MAAIRFAVLLTCFVGNALGAVDVLSWEDAYEIARSKVSQMSRDEKNRMMHSRQDQASGWFVGNIQGVPRLNIPSLNMQDNGNGFRTTEDYMIGTVTCWPSALALGASWDTKLVREVATAIGREFSGKGANVILGPGVFVQRVAKGGRNFETLAGEDPFLGSRLGGEFVMGVQSQGVVATLKHFIFNSQETHRGDYNSQVDDHTAWNLYYPTFQASVDAGAGAVMCSYNFEDGRHSCSNTRRLKGDLKDKMGFKGFVMSDWGAEHGTSISNGEDMDMVNGAGSDQFNAGSVPDADVNEAVTRTVATMYKMRLDNTTKCVGGSCDGPLHADVQGKHHQLAFEAAEQSIVLLKNNNSVLPLFRHNVKTIKVLGSAATAGIVNPNHGSWKDGDFYSGGGSGHVIPGYHVTPLDGIKRRAASAGITVVDETSNVDVDLIIVVGGTTSHEADDRAHLHLDDGADELIASVAAGGSVCPSGELHFAARGSCCCDCSWANPGTCGHDDGSCCFQCCHQQDAALGKKLPPVVVLLEVPGPILMPWADMVDGIALMFLGGQETGNAWAAVLFGDYSPTGHLPVSMPKTESDTIEPNTAGTIAYNEGMATGYRDTKKQYVFPFGHGLTYTEFKYGAPSQQSCENYYCVALSIQNVGTLAASAVPQLYLEFPSSAHYPSPVLKGFKKTELIQPGDELRVTFTLSSADVSYWDSGAWKTPTAGVAHIGASSADIRHTLPLVFDRSMIDTVMV